ncbi:HNH/endonuclease VII fold putative polymorphic toxin [Pseudomonas sp. RL_105y_Pfl1_103]
MQGRVYEFELLYRDVEIREHSLGHEKGNHAPHFNTEVTVEG